MADGIPETVELEVGEAREIVLPGLGAAGYQWAVHIEPAGGPIAAEVVGETAPAEAEPSSGGVRELLRITASSSGRATVEVRQRRPWEPTVRPLRTHVIRVVVPGA